MTPELGSQKLIASLLHLELAMNCLADIPESTPYLGYGSASAGRLLAMISKDAIAGWNREFPNDQVSSCMNREMNEGKIERCAQYIPGPPRLCDACEERSQSRGL